MTDVQFYVEWRMYPTQTAGYKSWYDCVYDSLCTASSLDHSTPPNREDTVLTLKTLLAENEYSLGRFLLKALSHYPGMQFTLFSNLIIQNSPTELNELQRLVGKVESGATVIAFVENEGSLMSFVIKKQSDTAVLVVALDRTRQYSVGHRAFIVLLVNALLHPKQTIDIDEDVDVDAIVSAIREKRVTVE